MPPGLLSPAAKLVLYTSMDQNKLALSVVKVSGSRGENAGMNGGWKSKQRADLTKLTAERCAGALLRGRFVVRVTWLGAASDCARGA